MPVLPFFVFLFTTLFTGLTFASPLTAPEKIPFLNTGDTSASFAGVNQSLYNEEGEAVVADVLGPGTLDQFWLTWDVRPESPPWEFERSGHIKIFVDTMVVPQLDLPAKEFFAGQLGSPWVFPLVTTYTQSSGGYVNWVPIQFAKRLKVRFSPTTAPYPYYKFNFTLHRPEAVVEPYPSGRPDPGDLDVLTRLAEGKGTGPEAYGTAASGKTQSGKADLREGVETELFRLKGPGEIRRLAVQLAGGSSGNEDALLKAKLRIWWDGDAAPAIDAPLGMLSGCSVAWREIRAAGFSQDPRLHEVALLLPMPFRRSARASLVSEKGISVGWAVTRGELRGAQESALTPTLSRRERENFVGPLYLRTSYHHWDATPQGHDINLLDTYGAGKIVGTVMSAGNSVHQADGRSYNEGDERIYLDGSTSPQIHGTGTEDYFLGGWYFWKGDFTLPFHGNRFVDGGNGIFRETSYRLHLWDPIFYKAGAIFNFEVGPYADVAAQYDTLVYYYAQEKPLLRAVDRLVIGDKTSEETHGLKHTGRVKQETASDAEWGPGNDNDFAHTAGVMETTQPFSFRLDLPTKRQAGTPAPLLRLTRRFLARGAQEAGVIVNGKPAGTWYTPVKSKGQMWSTDSFEVPLENTRGQKQLAIELTPKSKFNLAWIESVVYVPPGKDLAEPVLAGTPTTTVEGNTARVVWNEGVSPALKVGYELELQSGTSPDWNTVKSLATQYAGATLRDLDLVASYRARVRPVDGLGKAGKWSDWAAFTTENTIVIHGVDQAHYGNHRGLIPLLAGADVFGLSKPGLLTRYGGKGAGRFLDLHVYVPQAGSYTLKTTYIKGKNLGSWQTLLDGQPLGPVFVGFSDKPEFVEMNLGSVKLTKGEHTLTLRAEKSDNPGDESMAYRDIRLTADR